LERYEDLSNKDEYVDVEVFEELQAEIKDVEAQIEAAKLEKANETNDFASKFELRKGDLVQIRKGRDISETILRFISSNSRLLSENYNGDLIIMDQVINKVRRMASDFENEVNPEELK
jgi:hypothetical protein